MYFFFKLNFLPPYALRSPGIKVKFEIVDSGGVVHCAEREEREQGIDGVPIPKAMPVFQICLASL